MSDIIRDQLSQLKNWKVTSEGLNTTLILTDFMAAIRAICQIAELAEEANHHPDLAIKNYNELHISLITHSQGTVTEKDTKLAKQIDGLQI